MNEAQLYNRSDLKFEINYENSYLYYRRLAHCKMQLKTLAVKLEELEEEAASF